MNRILVIEDEEIIAKALSKLLERNHFEVTTATTIEQAIEAQPQSYDLILADLRLPGAEGTTIIPIADPIPVVIMTSHASVRSAVTAMRAGAIDYIAKPFDHDELLLIIERSLMQNKMRALNLSLKQDLKRLVPAENIMHCSDMQPTIKQLTNLDNALRFISLHGERGTGKELLARIIHANSDRAEAPFVVADLPSIDPTRMEAYLLGADVPRSGEDFMPGGLLHAAHNGTLVIRYPNAMPMSVQTDIAKTLTSGGMPGRDGMRSINVRTILISEVNLAEQSDSDQLDASLTKLFHGNEFEVPSLRERASDILRLAEHFLSYFSRYHHRNKLEFSDNAKAAMQAYRWPGNTDELKTLIERAVLLSPEDRINASDLRLAAITDEANETDLNLEEYFRYYVTRHQTQLSETELASRLGISRKALWERRQKTGLTRD